MKHLILIAITFLFSSLETFSQDFVTRLNNGDRLFFHITDTTKKKVEIVRVKALNGAKVSLPSGNLEIPSTVKYKDTTYYVMSIGLDAFAGAEELTSVTMPSSITQIGDRAFSGCPKLKSVVFPSCKPKIGEHAFENCKSLSSVSFGSDWTSLELQLFEDSASLTDVYVPARAVKVTGVKLLPNLKRIDVDPNNLAFSSHDGMLYSKDGKTFYACPRARKEKVSLVSGTEKVLDGAFRGCTMIEEVYLPASVHELSYDEFAGCTSLTSITMLSEIPPITAKWNGATVFAIKSPGKDCRIYVPKENLTRYRTAICYTVGLYETLPGARKEKVGEDGLIGKTAVKKIKKQR
jgi:hypothetical protein